ncbi:HNH endonuclease signature motif containing protein [Streptomyces sp. NPDC017086]|uniref:HNH endonuclease signature motif containing protein n=1 Tax=Streptomyces sp. NPDC017086 TaxID=3364976 RepID=UPI0037A78DED
MQPTPTPVFSPSVAQRFWPKVDKTDTCWLWTAHKGGGGYGRFKVEGRMVPAHRVAYELASGVIPDGFELDHLCRVRHCVNPAHLEPVTGRENTLRGQSPSAQHAIKTHCANGHPFNSSNTYLRPTGGRACRACRRAAVYAYKARKIASRALPRPAVS